MITTILVEKKKVNETIISNKNTELSMINNSNIDLNCSIEIIGNKIIIWINNVGKANG